MTRVTLVTPAYNAGAVIRDCLESVAAQSLPCEHIVVDGGSTDDTARIARGFKHVSQVISEPDRGMYDAMNKGILAASGEILGILNADDFYCGRRVQETVAGVFENESVDACYGDVVYAREAIAERTTEEEAYRTAGGRFQVVRYWKSGDFRPEKLYSGWMPPHPTFFVRRRVYEQCGLFDSSLGSAADYELILRCLLRHRIKVVYVPEVLVCMRVGGRSNATVGARIRANRMDRKAWRVNGLRPLPWTLLLKPVRKIPQWWQRPGVRLAVPRLNPEKRKPET